MRHSLQPVWKAFQRPATRLYLQSGSSGCLKTEQPLYFAHAWFQLNTRLNSSASGFRPAQYQNSLERLYPARYVSGLHIRSAAGRFHCTNTPCCTDPLLQKQKEKMKKRSLQSEHLKQIFLRLQFLLSLHRLLQTLKFLLNLIGHFFRHQTPVQIRHLPSYIQEICRTFHHGWKPAL